MKKFKRKMLAKVVELDVWVNMLERMLHDIMEPDELPDVIGFKHEPVQEPEDDDGEADTK